MERDASASTGTGEEHFALESASQAVRSRLNAISLIRIPNKICHFTDSRMEI
jgi:hypothetical protein